MYMGISFGFSYHTTRLVVVSLDRYVRQKG